MAPDAREVMHSPAGSTADSSAYGTLTLTRWAYNPGTGYLEASFSVARNSSAPVPDYTVAAFEIKRPDDPLDAAAYRSAGSLIVRIAHVPKDFEVLSLWISDNSEALMNRGMEAEPGVSTAAAPPGPAAQKAGANFKCDARLVTRDTSLAPKSEQEYQRLSEEEFQWTGGKILEAKQAIEENNRLIAKIQKEAEELRKEQAYQTREEQKAPDDAIRQREQEAGELREKNGTLKETIREYEEKMRKLKEKREAVS